MTFSVYLVHQFVSLFSSPFRDGVEQMLGWDFSRLYVFLRHIHFRCLHMGTIFYTSVVMIVMVR